MAATTAAATWPTVAEIRASHNVLSEGLDAIEMLRARLMHLVDLDIAPSILEDAETPSIELLGALTRLTAILELDLGVISRGVDRLVAIRDAIAVDDKLKMLDEAEAREGASGDA